MKLFWDVLVLYHNNQSENLIPTPKEYVLKAIETSAIYSLSWNVMVEDFKI